jgi:Cft2 family RNA processing exonuclease
MELINNQMAIKQISKTVLKDAMSQKRKLFTMVRYKSNCLCGKRVKGMLPKQKQYVCISILPDACNKLNQIIIVIFASHFLKAI